MLPKTNLTKGCMKNNCVKNANGKLNTIFCIHCARNSTVIPLYKIVATKVIIGHINATVAHMIAVVITYGLASLGFTTRINGLL